MALLLAAGSVAGVYQFWDVGSDSWFDRVKGKGESFNRGAATVDPDAFGDRFSTVEYLDQGWKPADSLWFYFITQGSDLLPYDFFMALEQPASTDLFRSNDNVNRYRYLPQKPTLSNPDGLPVGFVKDTYQGKEYVGLTCAACHTGQLNYQGTAIRIDGGPSGADMKSFVEGLAAALTTTVRDDAKRERFYKNVLARRSGSSADEVADELRRFSQRLTNYTRINDSKTSYGPYRLDAFGRIYNRMLDHLLNGREMTRVLTSLVADGTVTQAQMDAITKGQVLGDLLSEKDRDYLVARFNDVLPADAQQALRDKLYNAANAPVSYPFLWDVPHHDYVQWNGLAANAALGPVGRNTGEAIGVFGTLDWSERRGVSISSIISGQGFKGRHVSFQSSVNVRNLHRIERHLTSLQSPVWPARFPALQQDRVARGRKVFANYCLSCHATIARDDPARRVVAHMSRVSDIGTDPTMANNGANYSGWSGILRNQYVNAGVGDILIDEDAPVAALLTKATLSVIATPDPDKNILSRGLDWLYDLAAAFFSNDIKASVKHGNYDPDTTADPYASLRSYKARSLNGIWATAPYLHNGSIPTLYDLLLPKQRPDDPQDGEYRPDTFIVGSREFLPDKVGLRHAGYEGFVFDVSKPGNSNAGHEYGARSGTAANGDPQPALTREQRLDLVEYLKSL
jgi:mono/diheme cytochrome c family protein